MTADPLIARPIAVNILLALYETADRVVADARAITIPTQLLISGADFVVHHAPQHRFFERLGTPIKERHVLPGFYHDTFGEKERALAVDKARSFILARFAEPLNRPSLLAADRIGFTRDEADALASPLPLLSPRGLFWAVARQNMAIGGLLSDGIRLGHRTGFDSGSYARLRLSQRPRAGSVRLGRLDRQSLSAVDRMARHSPAKDPSGGALTRDDGADREARHAGARPGHRGGPWPVRARRTRSEHRSSPSPCCCATTATSTSRPAGR